MHLKHLSFIYTVIWQLRTLFFYRGFFIYILAGFVSYANVFWTLCYSHYRLIKRASECTTACHFQKKILAPKPLGCIFLNLDFWEIFVFRHKVFTSEVVTAQVTTRSSRWVLSIDLRSSAVHCFESAVNSMKFYHSWFAGTWFVASVFWVTSDACIAYAL